MQSHYKSFAALAGVGALALSTTAQADPAASSPLFGAQSLQSRVLASPKAATPAAAATTGAVANYRGKLIVKIVAANRSGLPTTSKLICSVIYLDNLNWAGDQRIYTAQAQVTSSKIACNVVLPYWVRTSTPETSVLRVVAFVTNAAVTQADPFPRGFGFIELDPPLIPLPADGAVTVQTIQTLI